MSARFQLFVGGDSPRSSLAAANLRALCDRAIPDDYELEIVDVVQRPDLADAARVLATPTVIRLAPLPVRRAIGDLSDLARLAEALDLGLPTAPDEEESS